MNKSYVSKKPTQQMEYIYTIEISTNISNYHINYKLISFTC